MSRDYAAEMRAVIDAEAQGTYASPVVAQHIVDKLRATDADLLSGWLDAQAVQFVRHAINLRDCSTRGHNRTAVSRSVFRRAAEEFAEGNDEALTTNFLGEVYVVDGGMRMPLAQMGRPERLFAADDYDGRARENAMRSAFLRAIDKKAGRRLTGEVFEEDKLAALWASLS
jgi:hypothetical protein